ASSGKGLGMKFLKHVERTTVLFHLISAESDDVLRDYKTIRNELGNYSKELLKKKEYVFLTKSDAVPAEALAEKTKLLAKHKVKAQAITILDDDSLAPVRKLLEEIGQARGRA